MENGNEGVRTSFMINASYADFIFQQSTMAAILVPWPLLNDQLTLRFTSPCLHIFCVALIQRLS